MILRHQPKPVHPDKLILGIVGVGRHLARRPARLGGEISISIISIREVAVFEQAIGGIGGVDGREVRGNTVADGIIGEALGGVRGLGMGGLSQAVQDALGMRYQMSDTKRIMGCPSNRG